METPSIVRTVSFAILSCCIGAGAVCLTGCEAASAGGEAIGSAFDALQSVFRAGKVDRFSNVSIDDSIRATREAGQDLQLSFVRTSIHPDQQKIIFRDDRKQDVVVTLVRRTGRMTEIRVDVGLFGPEGFSRLMLDRVMTRLSASSNTATRPGNTRGDKE
jgi:hypothetical protein